MSLILIHKVPKWGENFSMRREQLSRPFISTIPRDFKLESAGNMLYLASRGLSSVPGSTLITAEIAPAPWTGSSERAHLRSASCLTPDPEYFLQGELGDNRKIRKGKAGFDQREVYEGPLENLTVPSAARSGCPSLHGQPFLGCVHGVMVRLSRARTT